jgi:hypothetical protein
LPPESKLMMSEYLPIAHCTVTTQTRNAPGAFPRVGASTSTYPENISHVSRPVSAGQACNDNDLRYAGSTLKGKIGV